MPRKLVCRTNNRKINDKTNKCFKKSFHEKYGGPINVISKSPGSLWTDYYVLRITMFLMDAIDVSTYFSMIAYLKRKTIGHMPKKSPVFCR